ncbi:VOC family protein [Microvirga sp. W0021]|uniref:VOC family protein n=1 Tax=Hohaiivirga grylli TaxID=3133970 RepID=A0ABV0BJ51_9HYPH
MKSRNRQLYPGEKEPPVKDKYSLILYVDNVEVSASFYSSILKHEPLERFKDFAVFGLQDGFIIGLQSKHAIEPTPQKFVGGFELSYSDVTTDEVDDIYKEWCNLGIEFALKPTTLEFGYTFVAVDPDGHRLRICATDTSNIE